MTGRHGGEKSAREHHPASVHRALLAMLSVASIAAFSSAAFGEEIRLTCVGTAVFGNHKGDYSSEFAQVLVVNAGARRVNGKVLEKSALHVSSASLDFPFCANGICGHMNIDRISGRFVFSRDGAIAYSGKCKTIERPRF